MSSCFTLRCDGLCTVLETLDDETCIDSMQEEWWEGGKRGRVGIVKGVEAVEGEREESGHGGQGDRKEDRDAEMGGMLTCKSLDIAYPNVPAMSTRVVIPCTMLE